MSTTRDGFYNTPGELTISHDTLHHANGQGGIAILVTRLTFPAEMAPSEKAQQLCDCLKAVGLESDPGLIRVSNLSDTDRGQTEHEAVAVVKPTGAEEAQIAFMCADSAYGAETMFKIGCGVIAPMRDSTEPRAIAIRLPLYGAPIVTAAVVAGIILQSKDALAQRKAVLEHGVRQMVIEAAQLATQEMIAEIAKYRTLVDAGPESTSAEAVTHAGHSLSFTKQVVEALQLITTEPDRHYSLFYAGLDWKAGRAFCLTANLGIPFGAQRNKLVGQLLRDGFTATIVRVFECASSTDVVHFEAMALARSSIDRLLHTGVLPPSMTERLQCTLPGQPMRLMQPGLAAHAAVTPITLRARLHTVPMWRGHSSDYCYDQMDRHQMQTVNETSGVIQHEWDESTARTMIPKILDAAKHERISINLTITSDTTFAITPGPSRDDNSQLEKTCRAYCDLLRLSGETGISCRFNHAPPNRPNPIPPVLNSLMQYEPEVVEGIGRWSRSVQRITDTAPGLEGGGVRFDMAAQAGTGRFQPPSDDTTLALRSTNSELARSNAALKQQVAQLGAEQLTLRNDAHTHIQALMEKHQEETRKYVAEMREMNRVTAEAAAVAAAAAAGTQAKLDALVQAVHNLPEGAQVLRNAFSSPDTLSPATGGSPEPVPGTPEPAAKEEEDAPPTTGGAPPSPEHADGRDEERKPRVQPTTALLPDDRLNTTLWARIRERLRTGVRDAAAGSPRRLTRPLNDHSSVPGPSERIPTVAVPTVTAGPADAPPRLPTRSHVLDRHAADAHGNGQTPWSPDPTSSAAGTDQGTRTETPPNNAAPATPPAASPEGNAALRLERALLLEAIRIRRAHLLRTLELARTWQSLAEATCDRNACLPEHGALPRHSPTGPDPDLSVGRASTQAERPDVQDRQTPPQRHAGDPLDPCDSFSTMSSPTERNRSYARIQWAIAALDGAMDQSDDARIPPTTDGQEMSTCTSSTLEAMPPREEPTSLPTADSQPSPAQPTFPNRHLTDDERGTSSKYPEVKGDGAWPPAPDPLALPGPPGGTPASHPDEAAADVNGDDGVPPSAPPSGGAPATRLYGGYGPEPEGGNQDDVFIDDGEEDADETVADDDAHGNDHYEGTPPSSTDHPRPEHMVNAAVPDGRGVMIRAGSGFGSSVSDEHSTRPPEHVSANEKASPPAQDSLDDFNRKAAEAYFASMEAVHANPSAASNLVMLRALDKMLAGVKVHGGRAPPSSLAQYGYHPNDPLPPNRQLTEDERGTSASYPEVKGDGAMGATKKKAKSKTAKKAATKKSLAIVMVVPPDAPSDDEMDTATAPGPWVLIGYAPAPEPKSSVSNLRTSLASPPARPQPRSDEWTNPSTSRKAPSRWKRAGST